MTLIDNWRDAPKMFSMRAFAGIGAVQLALIAFPEGWLSSPVPFVPGVTWRSVAIVLSLLVAFGGGFGRVVDQGLAAPQKD